MTNSMTAFASHETTFANLSIHCEIRSVNHRYCDINLKIAERFRFTEAEIHKAIHQKLKRGKVECSLSYKNQLQTQQDINIDRQAVEALLKATRSIEQLMEQPRNFSSLEVLAFPGIQIEPKIDRMALQQTLHELVTTTIDNLLIARQREGLQLARLVTQRCEKMLKFIIQAKARLPLVLEQLHSKLLNHITELVENPDYDRVEQEMVLLTQKLDVDEELDRLETHIHEALRTLELNEPIGRRLDFLMQEMNREANTLGSKSSDKEMTSISIELKVLIEQIREQVQNIE